MPESTCECCGAACAGNGPLCLECLKRKPELPPRQLRIGQILMNLGAIWFGWLIFPTSHWDTFMELRPFFQFAGASSAFVGVLGLYLHGVTSARIGYCRSCKALVVAGKGTLFGWKCTLCGSRV